MTISKVLLGLGTLCIGMTLSLSSVSAQCTCMGGAAVGGGVPVYGSGSVSMLPLGSVRSVVSYRYGFGETYFQGWNLADPGMVKCYRMHYLDVSMAYGLLERLTTEAGLGMFPQKTQHFASSSVFGNGISHLYLGARYLFYHDEDNRAEWNVGGGIRIPLSSVSENLPQHIDPSTGAVGFSFRTHVIGSTPDRHFYYAISQTIDIGIENGAEYRYGPGFITAASTLVNAIEHLGLVLELRFEHRMRDARYDESILDTGSSVLLVSPQLSFRAGSFIASPFFDYPMYRYYNGHQLANDFYAGINLIWQSDDMDK